MKYRIKKTSDEFATAYYVQYKFFLFWWTIKDAFDDVCDFQTEERARLFVARSRAKQTTTYTAL